MPATEPTVGDVTVLVLFGLLTVLWLATVIPQGRTLDMHDFYLRFLVGSNRRLVAYIRQLHTAIGIPFPEGLEDLSELPEIPSRWRQRLARLRRRRREEPEQAEADRLLAVAASLPPIIDVTPTVPEAEAVRAGLAAAEAVLEEEAAPEGRVENINTAHFLANLEENYRAWRAGLDAGGGP